MIYIYSLLYLALLIVTIGALELFYFRFQVSEYTAAVQFHCEFAAIHCLHLHREGFHSFDPLSRQEARDQLVLLHVLTTTQCLQPCSKPDPPLHFVGSWLVSVSFIRE